MLAEIRDRAAVRTPHVTAPGVGLRSVRQMVTAGFLPPVPHTVGSRRPPSQPTVRARTAGTGPAGCCAGPRAARPAAGQQLAWRWRCMVDNRGHRRAPGSLEAQVMGVL